MTVLRDSNRLKVEYFDINHMKSYKYHCGDGLPDDARVVCFHGRPKPADVSDGWVKQCRS